MSQTLQEGKIIEVTPLLRDGKGYSPEFVWFCDKSLKYRGFFGDGDFGECVAINFSSNMMCYAISIDNVKAPILVLNYLVLHELGHWAQESGEGDEEHCKRWLPFLFDLLISLEIQEMLK